MSSIQRGEYDLVRDVMKWLVIAAATIMLVLFVIGPLVKGNGEPKMVSEMELEGVAQGENTLGCLQESQPVDGNEPVRLSASSTNKEDVVPAATDMSDTPEPQAVDAVAVVKSPVILRNIFGSTRNPGMRGQLLAADYGDAKKEIAVMRSLRWLKTQQLTDGSWPNNKVAMTGLAILTFLAHGEKPGDSAEFGDTVRMGIEYLMSEQRKNTNGLYTATGRGYAHAIATYAMCEAYGMTMNPNVKVSADAALTPIIEGQHPSGGWDCDFMQSERDETPVMGWCAQALKAAMMANFYHDPEALERASKMCVKGFKKNGFEEGGFGYTSPQKGGLTGVGTLCMQFHHAANDSYVRNSLTNIIYQWNPEWVGYSPARAAAGENPEPSANLPSGAIGGACPQYYCYYATQSVFQEGGDQWQKWCVRMRSSYVKAQFVIPAEEAGETCTCGLPNCRKLKEPYKDADGKFQEIGHWVNTDAYSDRPVMDTCLAALQLMLYSSYIPWSPSPIDVPSEVTGGTVEADDITPEIGL